MKKLVLAIVMLLMLISLAHSSDWRDRCIIFRKTFLINGAGITKLMHDYDRFPGEIGEVLSKQELEKLLVSYLKSGLAILVEPGTQVDLINVNRSSVSVHLKNGNERYLIVTPENVSCPSLGYR